MLPELEMIDDLDNVLLLVWIIITQSFKDGGFDQPLFVESLSISNDFQGDELLLFVIEYS